jgi:hypothetical protein
MPLLASQTSPPAQPSPVAHTRHWLPEAAHWPLWQAAAGGGVVQSPSPLQTEAEVKLPLLQFGGTQVTLAEG